MISLHPESTVQGKNLPRRLRVCDRHWVGLLLGCCAYIVSGVGALAADCSVTSIGITPIIDLGNGDYMGFPGGLYPDRSNSRPTDHEAAGVAIAQSIAPRDTSGNPDPDGRYVLISIGMSNTSQEFSTVLPMVAGDTDRNAQLTLVNGAQGGATASDWSDPDNEVWAMAMQRLQQQDVTANQVAIAWIKLAESAGGTEPNAYREALQADLEKVVRLLPEKFSNLRIAYLSSRIYAGYASTSLNPEPFAYESGFVVKWLIEKQLMGDPLLNFDASLGAVHAPWLSWGPYLWADGLNPRSDGLTWTCSDLADDGTHPSETGRQKVAAMLHEFLRSDSTARLWYLDSDFQTDAVPPAPPTNLVVEP